MCPPSKENNWNDFQKGNKGKYHSQRDMADAYYKSKGINLNSNRRTLREQYLGSTPSKSSKTGRKVIERMEQENMIRRNKKTGTPTHFKSLEDRKWYEIDKADMSHKNQISHPGEGHRDAVVYWNEEGRYYGAKSEKVREYMLNADNYYLEHKKYNRSDGAKLGITYEPPEVKIGYIK